MEHIFGYMRAQAIVMKCKVYNKIEYKSRGMVENELTAANFGKTNKFFSRIVRM